VKLWPTFRRKAQPPPPGRPLTDTDLYAATITVGERSRNRQSRNVTAAQLVAAASGLPAACANLAANDCSSQPLRLYKAGRVTIRRAKTRRVPLVQQRRLSDARMVGTKAAQMADGLGNVAEVTDHPVLELLRKPNEHTTGQAHQYLTFWFKFIAGESFDAISDDGKQMWLLYAHATNPIPADPGLGQLVAYYAYGRERSGVLELPTDRVLHYKNRLHYADPYHGYGPLHDCYDSARVLAENTDFDLELIENGNIPPGFLSLDTAVYSTHEAVKEAMKELARKSRGARGKTELRAFAGAQFVSLAGVGKDLQTLEKLAYHEARIRQCYGIPETVLNNRSSAFASAEVGDDQYWAGTIRPALVRQAEQYTEQLLPYFDDTEDMFFAYDDPVIRDQSAELQQAEIRLRTGMTTINEERAALNMPGIGEDGDVYRINGVPLDIAGQPQPSMFTLDAERPMLPKGGSNGYADGHKIGAAMDALGIGVCAQESTRKDHQHSVQTATGRLSVKLDSCHAGPDRYADHGEPCGCTKAKDDDGLDLEVPDDFIPAGLAKAETAAIRAASQEIAEAVSAFGEDAAKRAVSQVAAGQAINLAAMADDLADILMPSYLRLYDAGFNMAGLEIGDGDDLDPLEIPNAEAILESRTSLVRQYSKDIVDSTAQAIEDRVRIGLEQGQSIGEIAQNIEADTGLTDWRSERIARTEVQRATNEGKRTRYKEAGYTKVYWVTAPGATAVHRAIEAMYPEGQDIDKPFLKAGQTVRGVDGSSETYDRDIYTPPARPNCRCSIQARKNDRPTEGDDE
jgi:phage portal protein BeeE